MTRFTIVTPVFNGMPWLPEAVSSVATQRSQVDVEHLILDGGSTDGSREWLAANSDLGFRSILEPDEGQTDALIRGFEEAGGDLLGWLNSDDALEPGALARVIAVFESESDVVMVTGPSLLIDPSGRVIGAIPTPPDTSLLGMLTDPTNPPQPSTFFRAAAYRRCGGLDRRWDLAMDVDLWLRLASIGRVVALPNEPLSRFRLHPAAKSVSRSWATVREDLRVRRRHGMPIRSRAGLWLLKRATLDPLTRPAGAMLRSLVRSVTGHPPATGSGPSHR